MPVKIANSLAFMFETRFRQRVTKYAGALPELQSDYRQSWSGLEKHFNPSSALKK
jgi:homogentisate 1,2-dioxygenase